MADFVYRFDTPYCEMKEFEIPLFGRISSDGFHYNQHGIMGTSEYLKFSFRVATDGRELTLRLDIQMNLVYNYRYNKDSQNLLNAQIKQAFKESIKTIPEMTPIRRKTAYILFDKYMKHIGVAK